MRRATQFELSLAGTTSRHVDNEDFELKTQGEEFGDAILDNVRVTSRNSNAASVCLKSVSRDFAGEPYESVSSQLPVYNACVSCDAHQHVL